MDKEDFSKSSGEIPPSSNALRDVLESLRTIFVASIALVISIAEWIQKRFTTWQAKAAEQAKVLEKKRAEEQQKINQSRREEEKAIRAEKRKAEEQARIAEEQRAEDRAIREEERKAKEQRLNMRGIIYPILSAMSTIALVVGVTRLAPIAKWTRSQNECIEKTSPDEGANNAGLANNVMRYNGGHD